MPEAMPEALVQSRPIIIVMAKAPQPDAAKTRLMPLLSGQAAASLAACLVADIVRNALAIVPDVMIAYTPAEGRKTLASLVPEGLLWFLQPVADLGGRMQAALEHAAALGYGPLIMTGTDSPTLPLALIEEAICILKSGETDLVLGPAEDGGYYLIGVNRPISGLFAGVAWSTPLAYQQTADNAHRAGLRLSTLPQWYDIDRPEDLIRLKKEFQTDLNARTRAPQTWRWLQNHEIIDHHPDAE